MSRARSVPAFMVENSAPWMNGHGEREGEKRVGREAGQHRRRLSPPAFTRQQRDREDQRRDGARGLPDRPGHRAPGDRADLARERDAHRPRRSAAAARPRRRRPPASGRSWRGRRRRASALQLEVRRPRAPRRRARGRPRPALRAVVRAGPRCRARRRRRGSPNRCEHVGDRGRPGPRSRRRVHAGPADLGLERGRRALGDDVPVVDDPDPVGEHVGLLEVLRRQEDGHALLAREPGDLVPERGAALDVEPGRRLVEEEDARAGARARARGRAGASSRPSSRRPCGRPPRSRPTRSSSSSLARRALGLRDPLQRRLQAQVVAPGQQRVERRLLQGRADRRAHLRALVDDVVAGRRAPCPTSAAATSSASAPWSTCPRRSGRGSRRSRPASTWRSIPSTARGPFLKSRTSFSTSMLLSPVTSFSLLAPQLSTTPGRERCQNTACRQGQPAPSVQHLVHRPVRRGFRRRAVRTSRPADRPGCIRLPARVRCLTPLVRAQSRTRESVAGPSERAGPQNRPAGCIRLPARARCLTPLVRAVARSLR